MDSTDGVRRLAAEGIAARQISEKLGISRARVYQIAKTRDIILPPGSWVSYPKPRPPVARVVTGGITAPISHTTAGAISEVLVAADLLARGWRVYMPVVKNRGHDLIASRGEKVVTVEVRSAKRSATGNLVCPRQPNDNSDIYALVITGEVVEYVPADWETIK